MAQSFEIQLNPNLYLRDPAATKLGRKIIDFSIQLIDKMGFEEFTFRKLASAIHSTEASEMCIRDRLLSIPTAHSQPGKGIQGLPRLSVRTTHAS